MGLGHGSIIEYVSLEMADIRKGAAIFFISMRQGRTKGVGGIAVQTALLHIVIDEGVHRIKGIGGITVQTGLFNTVIDEGVHCIKGIGGITVQTGCSYTW